MSSQHFEIGNWHAIVSATSNSALDLGFVSLDALMHYSATYTAVCKLIRYTFSTQDPDIEEILLVTPDS